MAASSRLMIGEAERRFPVRIRIGVPPQGLGGRLGGSDVLVRIRAAGLCHTDLEVITGSLRYPMPIVLGHEAAGIVEELGPAARGLSVGDHVILSWNPHCGHCFYCERDLPI